MAESLVKTVKNMMKKAEDRGDFQKSLMIYRSAPLQNGLSPAQMLMGRRIRSNLPVNEDLLTPKGAHKVRKAQGHLYRHMETVGTGGGERCSTFLQDPDGEWIVFEKEPHRSSTTDDWKGHSSSGDGSAAHG